MLENSPFSRSITSACAAIGEDFAAITQSAMIQRFLPMVLRNFPNLFLACGKWDVHNVEAKFDSKRYQTGYGDDVFWTPSAHLLCIRLLTFPQPKCPHEHRPSCAQTICLSFSIPHSCSQSHSSGSSNTTVPTIASTSRITVVCIFIVRLHI